MNGLATGWIASAQRSVRIMFVGADLAQIANTVKPRLLSIIAATFPNSKTHRLATRWVWFVQRDGLISGPRTHARYLGPSVPDDVGIYDVLWLVPDAPDPASYAWFANYRTKRGRTSWNYFRRVKKTGEVVKEGWRKRPRGFIAEATRRLRGGKAQQQAGPLLIQASFIRDDMHGRFSRSKYGVPAIRIAFRKSLARAVTVE